MSAQYRVEVLARSHDRQSFSCGVRELDDYLRQRATQDVRRRLAVCYVAVESSTSEVAGYYTLSAAGVLLNELPAGVLKKLPHYPSVPAARIGRLAVDQRHQKRGLGQALIVDAIRKAVDSPVAVFTMVVDAKEESGVAFYERLGFFRCSATSRTLFLILDDALRMQASGS